MALGVVVIAVAGYYARTAGVTHPDPGDAIYFDKQADAFWHGRLDLRPLPPPGLVALPDPYDPAANAPFLKEGAFQDMALRDGRFYLTWGPAPAVVLWLPVRAFCEVIFGNRGPPVSDAFAAFLFALLAWLAGVALLRFVIRRWAPGIPLWMYLVAAAAIATGDLAPFLLRRPLVYEVAFLSAMCFSLAAAYFLTAGAFDTRISRTRLFLGGTCCGLALASRPDIAVGFLALAALPLLLRARGESVMTAAWALAPAALLVAALLAFNQARFGSPFSTGVNDAVIAQFDLHQYDYGSFAYLAPGIYYLLFAPIHLAGMFPPWGAASAIVPRGFPGTLPPGFPNAAAPGVKTIEMAGLVTISPIALGVLALLSRARTGARAARHVVGAIGAVGASALVFVAYALPPRQRYLGDGAALLVVAGAAAWLLAVQATKRTASRYAVQLIGVAACGWTIVAGLALGSTGTLGH